MPPARASEPSDATTAAPSSKRRRIAVACSICRTRKSKCDGLRPTCTSCNELNYECHYDPPDSSTNVIIPKDYVSVLEQRLKQVEGLLQRHDDLLTGHLSACSDGQVRHDANQHGVPEIQVTGEKFGGTNRDENVGEAATDGLAITFVDEQTSAYFGQSSNIRFTRYLLEAASAIWKIKQPQRPSAGTTPQDNGPETSSIATAEYSPLAIGSPRHDHHTASVLPPELEMEDMITAYFASTGLLFPFIHENTFRAEYRTFKESRFTKVRKTWLGVLNIMFAMMSNTDRKRGITAKERFEKSLVFYRRAATLCNGPSFNTVSFDIVHYLLLQVLYLQGTQHSVQAWSVHGLLVRTAIALGLHSDQAGRRSNPVEQEVRRRTWQTIYCLDKVLSTTFGRPAAITEEQMAVAPPSRWPVSQDTEINGSTGTQHDTTGFLRVSVPLYSIMGHVIHKQYGGNMETEPGPVDNIAALQSAANMKAQLQCWTATLPRELAITSPNSADLLHSSPLQRLRTILTLRYHSVKILIHRPFLAAVLQHLSKLEKQSANELSYSLQLAVEEEAHACVSSAQETIEIMANILLADSSKNNNLGVWFFNLYYLFTASLVVFGRMLWAQHDSQESADAEVTSRRATLARAAEAIKKLDIGNHLVDQCAKYVQYLSELQDGRSNKSGRGSRSRRTEPAAQMDFFNDGLYDAVSDLCPYLTADMFDSSFLDGYILPIQE